MQLKSDLFKWVKQTGRKIIIDLAKIYSVFPVNLRKNILYYYKKNEFPREDPTVFYCFDSHWNSVESFLPILYWLKERMGYRIIVFWGKENEHSIIRGNEAYFKMLMDVSDVAVLNGFIPVESSSKTKRFERLLLNAKDIFCYTLMQYGLQRECVALLGNYNVISVLRVLDNDEQYWGWLYECFPLVKHIAHPHAFMGMLNLPDADWLSYYKAKSDVITWTDAGCLSGFARILDGAAYEKLKKRLVIVGMPRYDAWWLEKITALDYRMTLFNKELAAKRKKKKVLVCFGRLTILNPAVAEFLKEQEVTIRELNELKQFLGDYKTVDAFFVFKFHPSTALYHVDLNVFFQQFIPQCQFDFQVTNLPVASIARYVDLVVSVGISTVAMESVALGIPTIEFHEKRKSDYWYRCIDETYGSFLKLHQLALYASNAQELSCWVNRVLEGKVPWDEYYKKLQGYIMLDGNASKRVGDVVQRYVQPSV